jgi:hypothetical protein
MRSVVETVSKLIEEDGGKLTPLASTNELRSLRVFFSISTPEEYQVAAQKAALSALNLLHFVSPPDKDVVGEKRHLSRNCFQST